MKQEHRFVAELYSLLKPFIDVSQPLFLSLDGEAAKKGVTEEIFEDSHVPDLWFTICGNERPTTLEAKIVGDNKRITLTQNQISQWRSCGNSAHKPDGWVVVNIECSLFYHWEHAEFLPTLDACESTQRYPKLRIPENVNQFDSVEQLAMWVLRTHTKRSPCTGPSTPGACSDPAG